VRYEASVRNVTASLSILVVALTACGGAVEPSSSAPTDDDGARAATQQAPSALGLWVAPVTEAPGFLALDLCADGTVSFGFPADPSGVRERCASIGGSHRIEGARVSLVAGRARLEATLADGQLLVVQPEGPRTYYRTSRASDIAGTYALRTDVSHGEGTGTVAIERRFAFARGRFTFDNALSAATTGDRWSTVEQGSYAMSGPGDVVLTTDGLASHAEHVVAFGPSGEYLHIGRIGYMARATQP
jgi:hypothetical protein